MAMYVIILEVEATDDVLMFPSVNAAATASHHEVQPTHVDTTPLSASVDMTYCPGSAAATTSHIDELVPFSAAVTALCPDTAAPPYIDELVPFSAAITTFCPGAAAPQKIDELAPISALCPANAARPQDTAPTSTAKVAAI